MSWFPPCLAVLALLMLRAYPRRECLHLSLAFLTWSVVAVIAPTVSSLCFLSLAGMTLALAFLVIERVVRPFEPAICQRLGVVDVGYAPVVRGWASALFGLASILAIGVVFLEMGSAIILERPSGLGLLSVDWWALVATLGLLGAVPGGRGYRPARLDRCRARTTGDRAPCVERHRALVAGRLVFAAGDAGP